MSNVKVAVRVRPFTTREKDGKTAVSVQDTTVSVFNVKLDSNPLADSREREHQYHFDQVFWSVDSNSRNYASQETIYNELGSEVLHSATDGYNTSVFAYGPTGSGKTFTMMGNTGDEGLIPRICEGLFDQINDVKEAEYEDEIVNFRISVSYLEIYNEKVRDLLPSTENRREEKSSLKVREHPKDGPYVEGLSNHSVADKAGVQSLIQKGTENRTTAATHMHNHSSRSHAIFTLSFTQANLNEDLPSEIVSKIHLVDLAGSERADPTTNYHRGRLKEGANINKSLVALANVIQALAEKSLVQWSLSENTCSSIHGSTERLQQTDSKSTKQKHFIPYRDSVLTWLLKDSLGGNAKTIMIATISPSSLRYNETINTLRYARRAKNIINRPCVNEDPNVTLIRELRAEILRLRGMLSSSWKNNNSPRLASIHVQAGSMMSLSESSSNVAEKLEEHEHMVSELTKSFFGKWNEDQSMLQDTDMQIRPLRASDRSQSLGVIVDTQLPHLVCLDDDILSTGVTLYYLKEGITTVGSEESTIPQDIVLYNNVFPEHCSIHHDVTGEVSLEPKPNAFITVNEREIVAPVRLCQGDMIYIGRGNLFRFNHPHEAAKLRERRRIMSESSTSLPSDIECVPSSSLSKLLFLKSLHGDGRFTRSLSRCSSSSSINNSSGIDVDSSSSFSLFRGPSWNEICLEKEQQFKTDAERLEETRREMAGLTEERKKLEADKQEKEELLWSSHEQHLEDIARERRLLKALEHEQEQRRTQAQEELDEERRSLESQRAQSEQCLAARLREIEGRASTSNRPLSCDLGIQTLPDLGELAIRTESELSMMAQGESRLGGITDREFFMMTLERQQEWLKEQEGLLREDRAQMDERLRMRESKIEEIFLVGSEKIETKRLLLEEKEKEFKRREAEMYEEMKEQQIRVEKMQHKEKQLMMYEEEKIKEMAPSFERSAPLGASFSEDSLQSGPPSGQSTLVGGSSDTLTSLATRPKIMQSPSSPDKQKSKFRTNTTAQQVTDRLYNLTKIREKAPLKISSKKKKETKKHNPEDQSFSRSSSAPSLEEKTQSRKIRSPSPRLRQSNASLASVPETPPEVQYEMKIDTANLTQSLPASKWESEKRKLERQTSSEEELSKSVHAEAPMMESRRHSPDGFSMPEEKRTIEPQMGSVFPMDDIPYADDVDVYIAESMNSESAVHSGVIPQFDGEMKREEKKERKKSGVKRKSKSKSPLIQVDSDTHKKQKTEDDIQVEIYLPSNSSSLGNQSEMGSVSDRQSSGEDQVYFVEGVKYIRRARAKSVGDVQPKKSRMTEQSFVPWVLPDGRKQSIDEENPLMIERTLSDEHDPDSLDKGCSDVEPDSLQDNYDGLSTGELQREYIRTLVAHEESVFSADSLNEESDFADELKCDDSPSISSSAPLSPEHKTGSFVVVAPAKGSPVRKASRLSATGDDSQTREESEAPLSPRFSDVDDVAPASSSEDSASGLPRQIHKKRPKREPLSSSEEYYSSSDSGSVYTDDSLNEFSKDSIGTTLVGSSREQESTLTPSEPHFATNIASRLPLLSPAASSKSTPTTRTPHLKVSQLDTWSNQDVTSVYDGSSDVPQTNFSPHSSPAPQHLSFAPPEVWSSTSQPQSQNSLPETCRPEDLSAKNFNDTPASGAADNIVANSAVLPCDKDFALVDTSSNVHLSDSTLEFSNFLPQSQDQNLAATQEISSIISLNEANQIPSSDSGKEDTAKLRAPISDISANQVSVESESSTSNEHSPPHPDRNVGDGELSADLTISRTIRDSRDGNGTDNKEENDNMMAVEVTAEGNTYDNNDMEDDTILHDTLLDEDRREGLEIVECRLAGPAEIIDSEMEDMTIKDKDIEGHEVVSDEPMLVLAGPAEIIEESAAENINTAADSRKDTILDDGGEGDLKLSSLINEDSKSVLNEAIPAEVEPMEAKVTRYEKEEQTSIPIDNNANEEVPEGEQLTEKEVDLEDFIETETIEYHEDESVLPGPAEIVETDELNTSAHQKPPELESSNSSSDKVNKPAKASEGSSSDLSSAYLHGQGLKAEGNESDSSENREAIEKAGTQSVGDNLKIRSSNMSSKEPLSTECAPDRPLGHSLNSEAEEEKLAESDEESESGPERPLSSSFRTQSSEMLSEESVPDSFLNPPKELKLKSDENIPSHTGYSSESFESTPEESDGTSDSPDAFGGVREQIVEIDEVTSTRSSISASMVESGSGLYQDMAQHMQELIHSVEEANEYRNQQAGGPGKHLETEDNNISTADTQIADTQILELKQHDDTIECETSEENIDLPSPKEELMQPETGKTKSTVNTESSNEPQSSDTELPIIEYGDGLDEDLSQHLQELKSSKDASTEHQQGSDMQEHISEASAIGTDTEVGQGAALSDLKDDQLAAVIIDHQHSDAIDNEANEKKDGSRNEPPLPSPALIPSNPETGKEEVNEESITDAVDKSTFQTGDNNPDDVSEAGSGFDEDLARHLNFISEFMPDPIESLLSPMSMTSDLKILASSLQENTTTEVFVEPDGLKASEQDDASPTQEDQLAANEVSFEQDELKGFKPEDNVMMSSQIDQLDTAKEGDDLEVYILPHIDSNEAGDAERVSEASESDPLSTIPEEEDAGSEQGLDHELENDDPQQQEPDATKDPNTVMDESKEASEAHDSPSSVEETITGSPKQDIGVASEPSKVNTSTALSEEGPNVKIESPLLDDAPEDGMDKSCENEIGNEVSKTVEPVSSPSISSNDEVDHASHLHEQDIASENTTDTAGDSYMPDESKLEKQTEENLQEESALDRSYKDMKPAEQEDASSNAIPSTIEEVAEQHAADFPAMENAPGGETQNVLSNSLEEIEDGDDAQSTDAKLEVPETSDDTNDVPARERIASLRNEIFGTSDPIESAANLLEFMPVDVEPLDKQKLNSEPSQVGSEKTAFPALESTAANRGISSSADLSETAILTDESAEIRSLSDNVVDSETTLPRQSLEESKDLQKGDPEERKLTDEDLSSYKPQDPLKAISECAEIIIEPANSEADEYEDFDEDLAQHMQDLGHQYLDVTHDISMSSTPDLFVEHDFEKSSSQVTEDNASVMADVLGSRVLKSELTHQQSLDVEEGSRAGSDPQMMKQEDAITEEEMAEEEWAVVSVGEAEVAANSQEQLETTEVKRTLFEKAGAFITKTIRELGPKKAFTGFKDNEYTAKDKWKVAAAAAAVGLVDKREEPESPLADVVADLSESGTKDQIDVEDIDYHPGMDITDAPVVDNDLPEYTLMTPEIPEDFENEERQRRPSCRDSGYYSMSMSGTFVRDDIENSDDVLKQNAASTEAEPADTRLQEVLPTVGAFIDPNHNAAEPSAMDVSDKLGPDQDFDGAEGREAVNIGEKDREEKQLGALPTDSHGMQLIENEFVDHNVNDAGTEELKEAEDEDMKKRVRPYAWLFENEEKEKKEEVEDVPTPEQVIDKLRTTKEMEPVVEEIIEKTCKHQQGERTDVVRYVAEIQPEKEKKKQLTENFSMSTEGLDPRPLVWQAFKEPQETTDREAVTATEESAFKSCSSEPNLDWTEERWGIRVQNDAGPAARRFTSEESMQQQDMEASKRSASVPALDVPQPRSRNFSEGEKVPFGRSMSSMSSLALSDLHLQPINAVPDDERCDGDLSDDKGRYELVHFKAPETKRKRKRKQPGSAIHLVQSDTQFMADETIEEMAKNIEESDASYDVRCQSAAYESHSAERTESLDVNCDGVESLTEEEVEKYMQLKQTENQESISNSVFEDIGGNQHDTESTTPDQDNKKKLDEIGSNLQKVEVEPPVSSVIQQPATESIDSELNNIADQPTQDKPTRKFTDSQTIGFDVRPGDMVRSTTPVELIGERQDMILEAQSTIGCSPVTDQVSMTSDIHVVGLQPAFVNDRRPLPSDIVLREEITSPLHHDLAHGGVNVEIQPWKVQSPSGEHAPPCADSENSSIRSEEDIHKTSLQEYIKQKDQEEDEVIEAREIPVCPPIIKAEVVSTDVITYLRPDPRKAKITDLPRDFDGGKLVEETIVMAKCLASDDEPPSAPFTIPLDKHEPIADDMHADRSAPLDSQPDGFSSPETISEEIIEPFLRQPQIPQDNLSHVSDTYNSKMKNWMTHILDDHEQEKEGLARSHQPGVPSPQVDSNSPSLIEPPLNPPLIQQDNIPEDQQIFNSRIRSLFDDLQREQAELAGIIRANVPSPQVDSDASSFIDEADFKKESKHPGITGSEMELLGYGGNDLDDLIPSYNELPCLSVSSNRSLSPGEVQGDDNDHSISLPLHSDGSIGNLIDEISNLPDLVSENVAEARVAWNVQGDLPWGRSLSTSELEFTQTQHVPRLRSFSADFVPLADDIGDRAESDDSFTYVFVSKEGSPQEAKEEAESTDPPRKERSASVDYSSQSMPAKKNLRSASLVTPICEWDDLEAEELFGGQPDMQRRMQRLKDSAMPQIPLFTEDKEDKPSFSETAIQTSDSLEDLYLQNRGGESSVSDVLNSINKAKNILASAAASDIISPSVNSVYVQTGLSMENLQAALHVGMQTGESLTNLPIVLSKTEHTGQRGDPHNGSMENIAKELGTHKYVDTGINPSPPKSPVDDVMNKEKSIPQEGLVNLSDLSSDEDESILNKSKLDMPDVPRYDFEDPGLAILRAEHAKFMDAFHKAKGEREERIAKRKELKQNRISAMADSTENQSENSDLLRRIHDQTDSRRAPQTEILNYDMSDNIRKYSLHSDDSGRESEDPKDAQDIQGPVVNVVAKLIAQEMLHGPSGGKNAVDNLSSHIGDNVVARRIAHEMMHGISDTNSPTNQKIDEEAVHRDDINLNQVAQRIAQDMKNISSNLSFSHSSKKSENLNSAPIKSQQKENPCSDDFNESKTVENPRTEADGLPCGETINPSRRNNLNSEGVRRMEEHSDDAIMDDAPEDNINVLEEVDVSEILAYNLEVGLNEVAKRIAAEMKDGELERNLLNNADNKADDNAEKNEVAKRIAIDMKDLKLNITGKLQEIATKGQNEVVRSLASDILSKSKSSLGKDESCDDVTEDLGAEDGLTDKERDELEKCIEPYVIPYTSASDRHPLNLSGISSIPRVSEDDSEELLDRLPISSSSLGLDEFREIRRHPRSRHASTQCDDDLDNVLSPRQNISTQCDDSITDQEQFLENQAIQNQLNKSRDRDDPVRVIIEKYITIRNETDPKQTMGEVTLQVPSLNTSGHLRAPSPTPSEMVDESIGTDFGPSEYDDELERLRRERQRILDMLAKDMMPSKFQVEVAEAQLNYIIGQTDLLLDTIDDPYDWDMNAVRKMAYPEEHLSNISRVYLTQYRESLEQSRDDIEKRILDLERKRDTNRKTRRRRKDFAQLRRDAAKEAFQLERHREQTNFSTIRNIRRKDASDSDLKAKVMTPKERADYLTHLRRGIVHNTHIDERSSRSVSPANRSYSSGYRDLDSYHTYDVYSIVSGLAEQRSRSEDTRAPANTSIDLDSSLDEDSARLLGDYQRMRGEMKHEIRKAKTTLQTRQPRTYSLSSPRAGVNSSLNLSSSSMQSSMDSRSYDTIEAEIDNEIAALRRTHALTTRSPRHYDVTSRYSERYDAAYEPRYNSLSSSRTSYFSPAASSSPRPDSINTSYSPRLDTSTSSPLGHRSSAFDTTRPIKANDIKSRLERDRLLHRYQPKYTL